MDANMEFINTRLSDKLWRLNNLYKIIDKQGQLVTLKLNDSQRAVLTQYKHKRKIILKSRQQGISTLKLAKNLDSCIFRENFSAGIQSYGKSEAKKLQIKAKLMWEHFDEDIKKLLGIELITCNQEGMMFSNGSILKIGNFRGDTLQSLHVSELAKIAAKFPDKAQELKTGAFQAVGQGNSITIESTAEGKSGLFYEMWVRAEAKARAIASSGGDLSPFDFQPIFLSWMMDPHCRLAMEVPISQQLADYFATLEARLTSELNHPYVLDDEQKWWYAAKYEEIGQDIKQEYPSTPDEAFMQPIEGTYYANEFKTLSIKKSTHIIENLVHMGCDLGMNDTFSIGFFQIDSFGRPRILGEHLDSGLLIKDYKDICDAKAKANGWTLGYIYCPHDVTVRELGSGQRIDTMRKVGFKPLKVKRMNLMDGIQITRDFLRVVEIDESCENIILAIQNYRKKYNQQYDVYLDSPVHDQFSHTADMVRYIAVGLKLIPPPKNSVIEFKRSTRLATSYFGLDL